MSPQQAVERLLLLDDEFEDEFDDHIDGTARVLLTALCSNLSFAMAASRGSWSQRIEARERAAECIAGIGMVLDVWRMAEVEIVDGPYFPGSFLYGPMLDS